MNKIPVRCIEGKKNQPNSIDGFKIHSLEKLLDGRGMQQKTHRHNFYFVMFVENGNGEHIIDFKPYTISKHNVFFLKPGQVHSLHLSANSKGYIIQFAEGFFQARKFKVPNNQQLKKEMFYGVKHIVSKIENEHNKKLKDYKTVILSCLKILLIELSRHDTNSTSKNNVYSQQRLEEFLALIETNFKEQKTVGFYAKKMNLSVYQINAFTKSLLGKTPSALITEQVILEAKRQLLATSNQVRQIAYLLGYEDPSYFIRFFKKHVSFSPAAFRKNFE